MTEPTRIDPQEFAPEVAQMHERERSVRDALDSIEHYDHGIPARSQKAIVGGALTAVAVGAMLLFAGPGSSVVTTAAYAPGGLVSDLLSGTWSSGQAAHSPENCWPTSESQGVVASKDESDASGKDRTITRQLATSDWPAIAFLPFHGADDHDHGNDGPGYGDGPGGDGPGGDGPGGDGPGGDGPGGGGPGGDGPGGGGPGGDGPGGDGPGGGGPGGGGPGKGHKETNLIEVDVDLFGKEIADIGLLPGELIDVDVDIAEKKGQLLDTEVEVGKGKHDILEVELEADKGHGEILDVELDVEKGKHDILEVEVEADKGHGEILNVEIEVGSGGQHGGKDGKDYDGRHDGGILGGLLGH